MALTFTLEPPITPALRDQVLDLWTDVSNAGGAVGFVPPVAREQVRPELVRHFVQMTEGRTRLLAGHDAHGDLAAVAFLARSADPLSAHTLGLYSVMVHPKHQGKGHGRALMAAAEAAARATDGIEVIRLSCRGGHGLERFYAGLGYREAGRIPGAVRVAPGDDRDEIIMVLPLG
ncbi:GNAT family N-acetyltransferase [Streptomyces misionensis]|uniref:GNAT family N-acetyltransferase n=1 Tax=Streptomyces misionensis TaxID=67331 RepID=A0A5C6JG92_9ACTN|nr:GNAT family N-acetyltransferase [Streptomyces misionensis]TWV40342.1 GNAT family N-acetyltransferase [Streptomyces misionensis]